MIKSNSQALFPITSVFIGLVSIIFKYEKHCNNHRTLFCEDVLSIALSASEKYLFEKCSQVLGSKRHSVSSSAFISARSHPIHLIQSRFTASCICATITVVFLLRRIISAAEPTPCLIPLSLTQIVAPNTTGVLISRLSYVCPRLSNNRVKRRINQ